MKAKKTLLISLLVIPLLSCGGGEEKASISGWKIPDAFTKEANEKGKVEKLSYLTQDYAYGTGLIEEKECAVYLPYGYTPTKQYDIIYLLHGTDPQSVDHLATWFYDIGVKNVLDNMIEKKECDPLIVVCPTFYSYGLYGDDLTKNIKEYSEVKAKSNENFPSELRYDLIPAVESFYSTYALTVTQEGLAASRHHRAMAGLSNGCRLTMQAGVVESLDLFASFGCYSSSIELNLIEASLDEGKKKGYGVDYWFNADGIYDFAHHNHVALYNSLLKDGYLTKENSSYQEIAFGWHSNRTWGIAFYDTLQLLFKD